MKNERIKLGITIGLAVAHNFLFWDEYVGLNMLLFSLLFIGVLLVLYRENFKGVNIWLVLTGSLITAGIVVIHNSSLSKVIHVLSMIILVGFIHYPKLRNIPMAFMTAVFGLFTFPKELFLAWGVVKNNSSWVLKMGKFLKLVALPILVLAVFYWIFIYANPKFSELSTFFWNAVYDYFDYLLANISFSRISMILFAFFIIGAALFKCRNQWFYHLDQQGNDKLTRTKQKRSLGHRFASIISLKSEYNIAVLTVGMVNGLLLLVNFIDIKWIWFGFEPTSVTNLSQFVHEGTYLLIGSILLSMGIMLYFFRSNLNFYPNNRILKVFCYTWIIQNAILCISVGWRNYHYITAFGLAYKRIGVVIFLIATIVGLITLIFKINSKYSSFYLWRVNAWSVYAILVVSTFINWDITIATYNLEVHKKKVDLEFLLSLSEKTTPIIYKHKELFKRFKVQYGADEYGRLRYVDLDSKARALNKLIEDGSWRSWNFADNKAYTQLKELKSTTNGK